MDESLMKQCRVSDEGLRIVKLCYRGRNVRVGNDFNLTVPYQKATANYVPAAAVIHRWQALSGFIGRKGCVGGLVSLGLNPGAQPRFALKTANLEYRRALLVPGATAMNMPLNYTYKGESINLSGHISKYKTLLAPNIRLFDNGGYYTGIFASYIMGMYDNSFYKNLITPIKGLNEEVFYAPDTFSKTGDVGYNKSDNKNAMGIAAGQAKCKDDSGILGCLFGYAGEKVLENKLENSGITYTAAQNNELTSTLTKGEKTLGFNSTGALMATTAGKLNIDTYAANFAGILDSLAETDTGAIALATFMNSVFPIIQDKDTTYGTIQQIGFSILTKYNGVGDPTSNASKQTKKVDVPDNFNPYQTIRDNQTDKMNDIPTDLIDQERLDGKPLGVDALKMSDEDLIAYDGTEVVKDSKGSAFPTLTFGDGVLKEYSFNFDKKGSYFSENSSVYLKNESVSSKNYSINFHFGDAESDQEANKDYDYGYFPSNPVSKMNEKEKINNFVAKKEFGDFYKFNQESLNFQNSLIGKVYEKNNNFNVETDNFDVYDSLTNDQKKDALSIFDYMFYLNNSTITDVVKNFMLNKFKLLNESSNGDKDSIEKGMNEYIGTVSNTSTKSTESDIVEKGFNGRIGNIIAISSSTTKEDSEAYFLVDNKSFEDSSSNIQVPNLDFDNSLKNYGEYAIFPSKDNQLFRLDAVGVDSLNVYPTIYEEDVLANQEKEAIFYIDTKTFKSMFNYDGKVNKTKFDDSLYQDVSRAYLNYNLKDKTNIKNDINLYQLYAADNITKLNEVSDAIKNPNSSQNRVEETEVLENDYSKLSRMLVEDLEDTKLLNLRSSLFDTISLMFLLISIVFCSLFVLIISFVVYNILKKLLINQRTQLVVTPNALTNMTKESYKNIKYNNDYSYSNVLSNNPITRYSFYEMNDDIKTSNYNASVFGAKVKNTDGNVLSVDVMNQIVDNINSTNYVKTNVNNLACKVIPTLFGQEDIKENINYDECIKNNGTKKGQSVNVYGLDKNSKQQNIILENRSKIFDYDKNSETIPVLINQKLKIRGYKVGNTLELSNQISKLTYKDSNSEYKVLDNSL
ncbi:hypothetical protein FQR65_LT16611 [Abscondita terminalis]|nr:hypothetical protein FQR65_LT16611 [Abscondita terminalis]